MSKRTNQLVRRYCYRANNLDIQLENFKNFLSHELSLDVYRKHVLHELAIFISGMCPDIGIPLLDGYEITTDIILYLKFILPDFDALLRSESIFTLPPVEEFIKKIYRKVSTL